MLKRMVIGLPRSGTTWAANWLTYGGEVCVHDPLYHTHYSDWERFDGVSCSGISSWPEFVRAQKCPILILHRPWAEVEKSLRTFDPDYSEWLDPNVERNLLALEGPLRMVVSWRDMFNREAAARIWDHLNMPTPFSPTRHSELSAMNIQPAEPVPAFADHALHDRLMAELRDKRERARSGG